VLAAAPAGDSSAEPSRSARKRKAVNFENTATPSALPRLLQSYGSTGGRSQQRPPRGVLTNLRNTYDAATPVPETAKAASEWRVEFGDGLSPYSFSPVPLRMDACEAASEDMDLDNGTQPSVYVVNILCAYLHVSCLSDSVGACLRRYG
jgi:hypothetical protein